MKLDTLKVTFTYSIAVMVLLGAFYGLVIYPFELDDLVKGALIGAANLCISFVFGQEIAKQTAAASQKAYDKGVQTPSITAQGDPPSVTVTPPPPTTDIGG